MNEDPKLILGACRPNGADAEDPVFAVALAAAQRDPQLAVWFREAQDFDRAMAGKLREIPVPGNLRAKILAGGRASRPLKWWARPRVWALAALLLGSAIVGGLWMSAGAGLAGWQRHALGVLDAVEAEKVPLDHELPEPEKLVTWLQERSAPVLATLPDALAERRAFGCKTWEWRGLRFSMVCFDLGGSATAHLISTWQGGLKGAPPLGHMRYARVGNWHTATWSEGGLACMLVTDAGDEELRKLLAQGAAGPPPRVASARRAPRDFLPFP